MLEIDVSDSLQKAETLLESMPGAAEKALQTSIRKSIRGAKKDAVQKVKERYTIKPSYVTRTMKVTYRGLIASLVSKGPVNDLAYFRHNPGNPPKHRPPTGVYTYAEVVKGQGGTIAHAFVARMKSGHVGVFQRAGHGSSNASLPIKKISGPSTPQMLGTPTVAEFIERKAQERMAENLDHEINAFLMGFRK